MTSVAHKEDDKENDYIQSNIIKFDDNRKKHTIVCEEEEEEEENEDAEEDKIKDEKYNMNTIKESIENNPLEKIYLKFYFTDEMYEELVENLPNDLLFNINGVPNSEQLLGLMEYVYGAWQRNGEVEENIDFPFAFHFSIVNKWVVENDKIFEQKYNVDNKIHLGYRPFFLEFEGYCDKKSFPELLDCVENIERPFLSGYFISDNSQEMEMYLREGWVRNERIISVLNGRVMVSASPIEFSNGKLVIVEDHSSVPSGFENILNDDIYKCEKESYTSANYCEIEKILNASIINGKPIWINVYNVGQAYCAAICMDSNKLIFSDIGLTKDKIELNAKEIKKAKKQIKKINPQMVILSHWDLDHILGITNASDSIYDAMWIVPDLWKLRISNRKGKIDNKLISDSAKRLLKYLDWKNREKLIIIDDELSKTCIYENPTGTMSIWSGERCTISGINENNKRYNITKANNFGLMIFLKNDYTALLPGDCEYSVMNNYLLKKEINFLVVPHHCSKMSKPKIKGACGKKKAVLSYGIHNIHHHPDNLHMKQISEIGYEIIPTIGKVHIHLDL